MSFNPEQIQPIETEEQLEKQARDLIANWTTLSPEEKSQARLFLVESMNVPSQKTLLELIAGEGNDRTAFIEMLRNHGYPEAFYEPLGGE